MRHTQISQIIQLRPAIKSKRRGLLSSGVLLQHENARPNHTARTTVATFTDLHFECLPHPPYSPDLAPSDFHMFGPLKEAMVGKKFRSDEEVRHAVHEWLRGLPKVFFLKEFMHFVSAGGLALSVGEIMLKSDTALYHFCTINNILKNI